MLARIRVLPLLLGLAALVLVARTGDLWNGLTPPELAEAETATGSTDLVAVNIALPPDPMAPMEPEAAQTDPEAIEPAAGEDSGTDEEMAESGMGGEGEAEMAAAQSEPEPVHDPFDISDEELELLQRLVKRREELEKRGEEMEHREALLSAAEARIEDKMQELKALQTLIESLLIQHDEQEEAQLASLVKIYEAMKPKQAAAVFEQLDMVVLLEVIGRMKERKSASVLAKMNPQKAKEITLELAQRREMPVARE